MKHSIFLFISIFLLSITPFFIINVSTKADTENILNEIYIVYDENNNIIFEGNIVEEGDKIIDKNFKEYEIYNVDHDDQIAYAEYTGYYKKQQIHNKSKNLNLTNNKIEKNVGIYLTHNDESYVPTDNTSSVYGKGGIHDVANSISDNFKGLNYNVYIDETLHLPHNSSAYSRSEQTAKNLLKNNLNAIFDIHRDGVSRSVFVKNVDGKERCKVRIVVGQANPNKEANLQFAMYLVEVAKEYCPWLFLDIYYAKGHYNQELSNKALLFEMGTYLCEKELVLETVPYLTQVIDKTLFSTIVEDDNSLTITDEIPKETEEKLVNNVLDTSYNINYESKYSSNVIIFTSVFTGGIILVVVFIIKNKRAKKS